MSSVPPTTADRRAGSRWPWIIAAMLGANMLVCGVTVFAALSNPAATAVEADYFQRSLDWDADREAWRTPAQAGWVTASSAFMRDGKSVVRVEIAGRDDEQGLRATVFHKAQADERAEIVLVRTSPGVFESWLPANRAGLWEIRLRDETARVRFDAVVELAPDGTGG